MKSMQDHKQVLYESVLFTKDSLCELFATKPKPCLQIKQPKALVHDLISTESAYWRFK